MPANALVGEQAMTPERIAMWRKACDAATPGPWRFVHTTPAALIVADDIVIASFRGTACYSDGSLIAYARTAMPELLDEIERLRSHVGAKNIPHAFSCPWPDGGCTCVVTT